MVNFLTNYVKVLWNTHDYPWRKLYCKHNPCEEPGKWMGSDRKLVVTGVRIIAFRLYCLLLLHFATVHKPTKWVFNSSSREKGITDRRKFLQVSKFHGLALKTSALKYDLTLTINRLCGIISWDKESVLDFVISVVSGKCSRWPEVHEVVMATITANERQTLF